MAGAPRGKWQVEVRSDSAGPCRTLIKESLGGLEQEGTGWTLFLTGARGVKRGIFF